MKHIYPAARLFTFSLLLVLSGISASAQKYKTVEDTVSLNKEYAKVSLAIIDLTEDMATSQENIKKYESKVEDKNNDAHKSAETSSDQASEATNGSVKDAKKAKKRARAAYNDAVESNNARGQLEKERNRLEKINKELKKKQERLEELSVMKNAILSSMPAM